jgi:hypothetical protein
VMTIREYARAEGITLGTAYRRVWQGQVEAEQVYGRWLISTGTKRSESPVDSKKPEKVSA